MTIMGNGIHFHRKTIVILSALAILVVLWMAFGSSNKRVVVRSKGLVANGRHFTMDGKPFTILSGAMHYFRIPPQYWEDRIVKLKAMGLNTVETYVSWNLHEEIQGDFNFKDGLDIVEFIKTAQKHDLYVIMRPGPYICAEWDLGGLPSWLLHNPNIYLRSLDPIFMKATLRFFDELIPRLIDYQYSNGGPIIAWQIENEYLSYDNSSAYMRKLQQEMVIRGVKELLFTSDGIWQMQIEKKYSLPGVLKTVNFQRNETNILKGLRKLQPNMPLMVTEFWSGWFDHWGEDKHVLTVEKAAERTKNILKMESSINYYMLHGGTNFGFMNGANAENGKYKPTITSYDYDAPISESGDITPKYRELREKLLKYAPKNSLSKQMPEIPHNSEKTIYEPVEMQHFLKLDSLLAMISPIESRHPVAMEFLPINKNGGQGYGFTLYEARLPSTAKSIKIESYRDRAQVFYNSIPLEIPEPMNIEKKYLDENKTKNVVIDLSGVKKQDSNKLQILVENMGRVNFKQEINNQRKGILGDVFVDGDRHMSWKIYPLEFKQDFMESLNKAEWSVRSERRRRGPGMHRGSFSIDDSPKDTFVLMSGWTKGVCFVNGRNLGRYWNIGPQYTLYLPSPWLKQGENTIVLFEQEGPTGDAEVRFVTEPQLGSKLTERN
ncbi:beta-galactosidase-1-like protein 2 [Nematostella vectensis]|uniref:beta-galactosidase-1-like protein 2 n=1 Tax=Nematostella vectensis TaxID=45351 RepID=UPI0013901EB2|nr:beta-galactosidase-1-like protein 2 [Nematostella vectensis]